MQKRQRTDIVISDKSNQRFAVDAKSYTATKDAPGWPDLVKQFFFYEKAVKSTVNNDVKVTTLCISWSRTKLISAHVGKRGQGDTFICWRIRIPWLFTIITLIQ